MSEFFRRLRVLFERKRFDSELEEEMRVHLQMQAEENLENGMKPEEAERSAKCRFGNRTLLHERSREAWGWQSLEHLWQDLVYAVRLTRKSPGFAAAAILTLALGMGANTAIFSVVNAVILRPLPFAEPERLVMLQEHFPKYDPHPFGLSAPDCVVFEQRNRTFAATAAYRDSEMDLSGIEPAERVRTARVSASLFPLLGVAPLVGRNFTEREDRERAQVAVVSYGLWRRLFGADSGIVGKSVWLDHQPYTILGVMPPTFEFPLTGMAGRKPADLWVPISFTEAELKDIGNNYSYGFLARLKAGVDYQQARDDSQAVAVGIWREVFSSEPEVRFQAVLTPLAEAVSGRVSRLLWLLLGAVGLVLLIACANVASLLLTRATTRTNEIAIRTALGAGNMRLWRQFMTESALLAAIGGILGLLVGKWGIGVLVRLSPGDIPRLNEITIDFRLLLFTFALVLATAVVFAVMPAWLMSGKRLSRPLKEAGRGPTQGRGGIRLRSALVVSELALAVILLTGAGLLIRSFAVLRATDPGFRPERVLSMSVRVPEAAYREGSYMRSFYRDLLDRIRELPGVNAVAAGTAAPMSRETDRIFTPEGYQGTSSQQWPRTDTKWVTAGYFQALSIPVLRGRAFSASDNADSPRVVIVDKEIAERYWPGEDPVGKRLQWGQGGARPWLTVIGVAGNVKDAAFDQESLPATYVPLSQAEDSRIRRMQFVVRTAGDPISVGAAVRAAVQSLDRNIPVAELRTMFEVISGSMAARRFNMILLSVFAGLALVLTMVGVYGVVAYSVAQRTHEIGVRMALGARRSDVLRKILQQGLALIATGICVGLAGAALLTRLMSTLLFGIEPGDKITFALAALVLAIVAMLASYLPALRATRIHPVEALRHE